MIWPNRAFFQKCHCAVLEDASGSIVAAVLFGLSSLVRTTTPETAHVYAIIDKRHRRKGMAKKVFEETLKIIYSLGYKRTITDVYSNNHPAINFCHKMNFLLTASLPHCGYLKNYGHCTSYIFAEHSDYTVFETPSEIKAKI